MVEAFRLSFYKYDLMTPPVFHGVENYKTVWNNPLFHQSFWVSVKYMFGVSVPEWFLATQKDRSEEHTSELQSLRHLVCRLLLEKKNIYMYCGFSPRY